jgi:hypothetical protein
MRPKRIQQEKPAVELIEEASQLLRSAPISALVAYYVGVLPFVLALLYFWSDMARSAFADQRLISGTLGLSLLFIWMKCWQSVFARHLLAHLCGEAPPRWRFGWLARTAVYQAIVQPASLFILPVSLVLVVPTGWTYAFFANATVFAGGSNENVRTFLTKSWQQARLWSMQSHYVVFLFKVFGLLTLFNLMSAVMAVPFLMKTLLGIETVFSRSPWAALNTTLLASLLGLTYLCIGPWLQATYVLRCFYGESLRTGQDLKSELKSYTQPAARLPAIALLLVTLQACWPMANAAEELERTQNPKLEAQNTLSSPALDRSIEEVIHRREYTWRMPRESAPTDARPSAERSLLQRAFKQLESAIKEVGIWLKDGVEWLIRKLSGKRAGPNLGGLDIAGAIRGIVIILLIALAGLLVWLLFRIWQRRQPVEELEATPLAPVPNVADENVGADQLPEDGWIRLARELMERGELRLAVRALYLATLAHLAERNLISLARFKSNRDYERELQRRAHALGGLTEIFDTSVTAFERVWYGRHGVTTELVEEFRVNVERMKAVS